MTDLTGPTLEAYETATRAVHDVDCPEGSLCMETQTTMGRYGRYATAAVDAVWPLAVAEGRRQAARECDAATRSAYDVLVTEAQAALAALEAGQPYGGDHHDG